MNRWRGIFLLSLSIISLTLGCSGGQTTVSTPLEYVWAKTYGGISGGSAKAVQQTTDGGYIVAGSPSSSGSTDILVLKLNPDGMIQWQKAYGGVGSEGASSIQQTSDGGYIVAGSTASSGSNDILVLKLNPDGTIQWQKAYGGVDAEGARSIQQTSDGGYIVAGYTASFGAGNYDIWVLKLNPDGTIQWQKTYGGNDYDTADAVQQTSDGGYIVGGRTSSYGAGSYDIWVLKLNPDGTVQWQKTYGGASADVANAIQQTSDGGYIVSGWSYFGAGLEDIWFLKLNPDGTIQWQKTYGGDNWDLPTSIQQTSDDGYVVSGWTYSFGAGLADILMLKLSQDGTIQWQKTYGGDKWDLANSIQQTSDGGYIVAGYSASFGAGSNDIIVLKLNADGSVGESCAFIHDSAVVSLNTTVTGESSSADVSDTFVSPQNSDFTPVDSTVSDELVCS